MGSQAIFGIITTIVGIRTKEVPISGNSSAPKKRLWRRKIAVGVESQFRWFEQPVLLFSIVFCLPLFFARFQPRKNVARGEKLNFLTSYVHPSRNIMATTLFLCTIFLFARSSFSGKVYRGPKMGERTRNTFRMELVGFPNTD